MKKPEGTLEAVEQMLIALKKAADTGLAGLCEPGFGLDAFDLAAGASIIDKANLDRRRKEFVEGSPDPIPEFGRLMCQNGWAEMLTQPGYLPVFIPTARGLEHARYLSRPWRQKAWEYLKGDVRTVVIAVITAVVTTWVPRIVG